MKTENKSESYNFFIYILSKAKTGYIWQNQSRKFHKKKNYQKHLKSIFLFSFVGLLLTFYQVDSDLPVSIVVFCISSDF